MVTAWFRRDSDAWEEDQLHRVLSSTVAVKNFDLTFHVRSKTRSVSLILDRVSPWKEILPQDLPLALWPHVLAKANSWNQQTGFRYSHSSLDALFFLIREKNDVLLQNVHRRRIRKRKRFQFSYYSRREKSSRARMGLDFGASCRLSNLPLSC